MSLIPWVPACFAPPWLSTDKGETLRGLPAFGSQGSGRLALQPSYESGSPNADASGMLTRMVPRPRPLLLFLLVEEGSFYEAEG